MKKKRLIADVLLLAVVFSVYVWGQDDNSAGQSSKAEQAAGQQNGNGDGDQAVVGKPAPDFTLADPNGQSVSLSDFRGEKIVVLEWTNYDCPFVKAHHREETFKKLAAKYPQKEVAWLTVNSTHYATAEDHKAFVKGHQPRSTLLADASGEVGRLYGAKTTPHLYVIDKEGTLVYEGAIDNAPLGRVPEGQEYVNYVDRALQELRADEPVSQPETKPYGCSVKYPPEEQS